jgi:predicted RNase H-related nuclease YkuK (DUF458 family)
MFKNKFKKFGGEYILDIIEYLKDYIEQEPNVTISIGCDSVQRSRKTVYAVTIMLYNTDIRRGAHVVFFRESFPKIKENIERLGKEVQYVYELGMYLDTELSKFYVRKDLTDIEKKRYKYHISKCNGEYSHIPPHKEESFIKNISLSGFDLIDFRLVDIHVDFNPFEETINKRGVSNNKSYVAYKNYVPWLRGLGFRTWVKPKAHASTSAADLLLKD